MGSVGVVLFLTGARVAAGLPLGAGFGLVVDALFAAGFLPASSVRSAVGLRRLPFRCVVSRRHRLSALVRLSLFCLGTAVQPPLALRLVLVFAPAAGFRLASVLGLESDLAPALGLLSPDGLVLLSDRVRGPVLLVPADFGLLSERVRGPVLRPVDGLALLSDLGRGLALLAPAGLGLLSERVRGPVLRAADGLALLVDLAAPPVALFLATGFALLAGLLLPSARVAELCALRGADFVPLPGFVPVPGRLPVRCFLGLSVFGSGLAHFPPLALALGRGFLPALGFRPAELFALGDALPLPAAFLMVN